MSIQGPRRRSVAALRLEVPLVELGAIGVGDVVDGGHAEHELVRAPLVEERSGGVARVAADHDGDLRLDDEPAGVAPHAHGRAVRDDGARALEPRLHRQRPVARAAVLRDADEHGRHGGRQQPRPGGGDRLARVGGAPALVERRVGILDRHPRGDLGRVAVGPRVQHRGAGGDPRDAHQARCRSASMSASLRDSAPETRTASSSRRRSRARVSGTRNVEAVVMSASVAM